jgi:hypothetical protein
MMISVLPERARRLPQVGQDAAAALPLEIAPDATR